MTVLHISIKIVPEKLLLVEHKKLSITHRQKSRVMDKKQERIAYEE